MVALGAAALWVAAAVSPAWSLAPLALCAALAWIFRVPVVTPVGEPLALASPVRGRVMTVDETRDPWLERSARRVRVAMDFPGVGVVLSPTEGKIMDFWIADRPFSAPGGAASGSRSPNCYGVWVQTDEGDDIVVAVSSLVPVSRFKLDLAPGERVGHGKRNGFVYFGSFVDVLMPLASRVEVEAGERVSAGGTVLARLVRE